jgi:helix-turn-helix protein
MATRVQQDPPARRHRFTYTDQFRSLPRGDREQELTLLKKLYEQDRLTIRQLADLLEASYGFMQKRLADAGTTTNITRRKRTSVSADAAATIAALPSRRQAPS